jgi:phage FluMu protein Com
MVHWTTEATIDDQLVRCLSCRKVYAKPGAPGSAQIASCPRCGYVGWISAAVGAPKHGQ